MPEPPGRGNPHLLSQMKTEQVSEGRYDEHGGSVDVAGAAMPMQKIETVNIPRSEALAGGQTTWGSCKASCRTIFRI